MPELTWQKSTYSEQGSACVEIAATPTTIHIRDSKTPTSPHLTLQPTTWAEFVATGPGVPGRGQAPQPPCA